MSAIIRRTFQGPWRYVSGGVVLILRGVGNGRDNYGRKLLRERQNFFLRSAPLPTACEIRVSPLTLAGAVLGVTR